MSLLVRVSYLLPHRFLSRLALYAARWRFRPWKNLMIGFIAKRFGVDWSEAEFSDIERFEHFNAFFTRGLKAGVRPLGKAAVLMPADGRVSQAGPVAVGRIMQAKGRDYSLAELLADAEWAQQFEGGVFATIYLSPKDYHRAHMPAAGTLVETRHVPGRLFSVSPSAVNTVPSLFARNERLVCRFDTDFGPMAVVMVGALLVSGVASVWAGDEIPPYADRVIVRDYRGRGIQLARGAEMARFNYGSTVIVVLPKGMALEDLPPELVVRMGQDLARSSAG